VSISEEAPMEQGSDTLYYFALTTFSFQSNPNRQPADLNVLTYEVKGLAQDSARWWVLCNDDIMLYSS
jgi:hypothetical protein